MSAILFGSLSTLAETSDLQRAAYNQAFAEHGMEWNWSGEKYRALLTGGGRDHIAEFARERGETVDAEVIRATASKLFDELLSAGPLDPRAGVAQTISEAKARGWKIGLATTASGENVEALLDGLGPKITRSDFSVLTDRSAVDRPKPDPAIYTFALRALAERAADCVAVEDDLDGVHAAGAAGLICVALPNVNTVEHDFGDVPRTARLVFTELAALVGNR